MPMYMGNELYRPHKKTHIVQNFSAFSLSRAHCVVSPLLNKMMPPPLLLSFVPRRQSFLKLTIIILFLVMTTAAKWLPTLPHSLSDKATR